MATITVSFATNRRAERAPDGTLCLANDLARYQDRPYLYRVGQAEVARIADPWQSGGQGYRLRRATLLPETLGPGRPPRAASPALFETLRRSMAEERRDAILYIHGFASTFASAMERAAELTETWLCPGTDPATGCLERHARAPHVIAFAWPSDGELFLDDRYGWAYSGDRADAKASGLAMARFGLRLVEFLKGLARRDHCGQRIHLVAHSMGNWALRHAVQSLVEIAAEEGLALGRIFDDAFLMGSDIEADALERRGWLAPLTTLSRRVHVYHAENDRALSLSDWKPNQGARLGHLGPARMAPLSDRVSAVDCSAVSDTPGDRVRHQYYRLAPEVLRDVRAVLAGQPATEMPWRRRGDDRGRWRIHRDPEARAALALAEATPQTA